MKHDWQELTRLTDGKPIVVERVRVEETGIAIEGEFELPSLARLSVEDQVFMAAFVRCHGSIKQMEKFFGVSYPTIKNRLNRIGAQLEFVEIDPSSGRGEVLDALDRGEITVEQAGKIEKRRYEMTDSRHQILAMLAEGKISVEEAERLLAAVDEKPAEETAAPESDEPKKNAKYLHIKVDSGKAGKEQVNIKIPLKLVRTGMVLGSLMPSEAKDKVNHALREKGITVDLNNLKSGDLDEVMSSLCELDISVDDENDKVRIYCE